MGKDEVKVLSMWASPFCTRVKIALAEKGVAYEEILETDLFGDKTELLLKSNPVHKQVPVLLHNDKPIVESTNIITYIDQVWPSPAPLMPACAYERSRSRFLADFIDRKVVSAGRGIWMGKGEEQVEGSKKFLDALMYLDGTLGDKDYFSGESFGMVDILLIGLTSWFSAFEKYGNFKVEDHCPKLSAWIKRCYARQSVSECIIDSDKICDLVAMVRKMNGLE